MKQLALFVLLCCLGNIAHAQQYREMLGPGYPVSTVQTPRFGISVQTNDFGTPRWKRLRKSENWLRSWGVPEEFITGQSDPTNMSLRWFAETMWSRSDQIEIWTDDAWQEIGDKWRSCGSAWAERFDAIDPRSLFVTVEPTAFWVPEAGQWRGEWQDGYNVRAMVIYVQGATSGGPYWVKHYRNQLAWAFGNAVARRYGLFDPSRPVGNTQPCR